MLSTACSKHGASKDRASSGFTVWTAMKGRCNNPNDPSYKNYGGRGISVCERWSSSFENFISDMGERPAGMSIDRINNDGNYEPSNCRWADVKMQSVNRRTTRHIEIRGTSRTIEEWSNISGIPRYDIYRRYVCGWDAEGSVFTPVGPTGPKGTYKTMKEGL